MAGNSRACGTPFGRPRLFISDESALILDNDSTVSSHFSSVSADAGFHKDEKLPEFLKIFFPNPKTTIEKPF